MYVCSIGFKFVLMFFFCIDKLIVMFFLMIFFFFKDNVSKVNCWIILVLLYLGIGEKE